MISLLLLYIFSGLLLIALSIPLILRKIKPNGLYGFRVPQTLADPDLWYAVNAHAGKRLLVSGIIDILAAIGFSFIPGLSIDAYALLCLSTMGIPLIFGMIQSFIYMNSQRQHKE